MNGKGNKTEIQNYIQQSKQDVPESRIASGLQPERRSSRVIHKTATLNEEQTLRKSINTCAVTDNGDLKNMQFSDTESDFAGFASVSSSIGNRSERHCVLKKSVRKFLESNGTIELESLNMNNSKSSQDGPKGELFGDCKRVRLSNKVEAELHPAMKKERKNLSDPKEIDHPVPTPMDQIVEVNSKSTTSSEAYKRQKINSKLQLRLLLNQQALRSNSHNNKCSTETTSDFPVSSPSNPHNWPILHKNTLPADIFERNLALLTEQNPQMSLEEKINAWKCDLDLSDVEDVGSFDDLFKEHEELKQKVVHGKRNMDGKPIEHQYDFTVFRNEVLPRISAATTFKEKTEKLSISGAATLTAQRRMRAALEFECKKRQQLDLLREKGATTPTFTSSSENDVLFNSVSKQIFNAAPKKLRCKGSDKANNVSNGQSFCDISIPDEPIRRHSHSAIENHQTNTSKRPRPLPDEESLFKLCRLNKEIDKINQRSETNTRGLIQMRFDFAIQNKSQHLHEKRSQLFKTPTVPSKYLPMPEPIALKVPAPKSKKNISFSGNTKSENAKILCRLSDENEMPMQISCASPPEADRSDSECSPSPKTIASAATCHQQHEFCNYLGLTGMSTANAVANAVAELAKCNLTRRSLRVRHLKHQEKKGKSQKVTKNCSDGNGLVQTLAHEMTTTDRSHEQRELLSNHTEMSVDLSESKWQLITEERTKNLTPIAGEVAIGKEPEIKIVCKISSNVDKEEANCAESVATPIRQTLLRHLKQKAVNSNDTSTCPRSSISDVFDGDEISSNPTPNILQKNDKNMQSKYRLSPTQISTCSSLKNTTTSKSAEDHDCIKLQLHDKFKKYLEASRKIKPSIYIVQALHNPEPGQCSQRENNCFVDVKVEGSLEEKKMLSIQSVNNLKAASIPKHSEKLQSKGENDNNAEMKERELLRSKTLSKKKKKEHLRKLLAVATPWHKIKNHRQLRSRKILLVKRIRSTSNTIKKSVKKTIKVGQLEPCSVVSSSKSEISNISSSKLRKEKSQGHKNRYTRLHRSSIKSRGTILPADDPRTSKNGLTSPVRKLHAKPQIVLPANASNNVKLDSQVSNHECETVVVSSTTNSYDEAMLFKLNNSPSQISREHKAVQNNASYATLTKDRSTQSAPPLGIHFLSTPSKQLPNPVKAINGEVDYIYYEMDVLIVVQEKLVSFWKYFKLINALVGTQDCENCSHRQIGNGDLYLPSYPSTGDVAPQWLPLGECRRLVADMEISTSYANRICIHNSIPIYVEMRCCELSHERRDCNLLSIYINIYYFNDEDMVAKMHSIQLDAVQCLPSDVVYTTITESRYFVMSWPQENILGKPRSGLCKYSLTPNLDTLASIRDFKHMRHCIRYLECTADDKLIGFGESQLTIWDHRSGDVLMNYDFNMKLGQNLGSIYYPSLEIGQNSMLVLFQYIKKVEESELAEVFAIACSVSHTTPSHRILKRLKTPSLAFKSIQSAINTGDNIVITAKNDEEMWINCADATTITRVPPQYTRRFYARGRSQIIELTCKTLTVDSFANHVLRLAANPSFKDDKVKCDV
ncbi:uncharacterized protein LOC129247369 isoform X1 [Anastrepha obliqua]|uniref:uncharacterized protein LOC129247369 isoform X1 n=1 Tax=Anastrepha obliqua TaxID=95512 RepID=UPI00240A89C1|nr:uncharacterized protein LOC129247369 isoform X1 [Anastrepha obliqua]